MSLGELQIDWPSVLFIAQGVIVTLKYTMVAVICGFIIGLGLAICKFVHFKPLNLFANAYTSVFRGTPLLIQLSLIYYAAPQLLDIKLSMFSAGVLAFSLNSGAYVSEIIRAGIKSIDKGQFEAAASLGVPFNLCMKDIILPQAIRKMLPSLVNEFINLIKESAIISIIGEMDLMRRAQLIAAEKYVYFSPMITAAICYYILVLMLARVAVKLEKKVSL